MDASRRVGPGANPTIATKHDILDLFLFHCKEGKNENGDEQENVATRVLLGLGGGGGEGGLMPTPSCPV